MKLLTPSSRAKFLEGAIADGNIGSGEQFMKTTIDEALAHISVVLGDATGFVEFRDGPINGLRRITGRNIDVLAVLSDKPGHGHFSQWLDGLMRTYKRIRFLHIESDILADALKRRGFAEVEWFEDGEHVTGMRWSK